MGLIIDTPLPIGGNLINDVVQPATVVRVCTDGSSSSGVTDSKSFDMTLYRVFSMRDDMKTLSSPIRVRSEFDLFIEYAEAKTNGTPYDNRFDQLDMYLGTIGISNEMC